MCMYTLHKHKHKSVGGQVGGIKSLGQQLTTIVCLPERAHIYETDSFTCQTCRHHCNWAISLPEKQLMTISEVVLNVRITCAASVLI